MTHFISIFILSLRKELLELWRTRRFLVLVVVLVAFGMLSPLMAKLMPQLFSMIPGGEPFINLIPEPTIKDAIDQYLKNIGQFGIMLALLLSMGAVVMEKERGTAALMLVKPLPRAVFILAKAKALALAFLVALILAGLAGYAYTVYIFGPLEPLAWVVLNLLLWLQFMVFVAITLLFSTLLRSQAAALGLSFGVLLVLSAGSAFPRLAEWLPGQLGVWAGTLYAPVTITAWPAVWVSLALIALCLSLACLLFHRQEL